MDSGSMFQFHPELQAKNTSRSTTPRNLVFPEAAAEDVVSNGGSRATEMETPAATSPRGGGKRHAPSARKYAVNGGASTDSKHEAETGNSGSPPVNPTEQFGLSTGLPSARADDLSARGEPGATRIKGASSPSQPSRRTLRGSLHYLKHESVMLTRALVRTTRHLYRQLSLQQLLAYLLILFGLLSESFTPAPRYNVPIGIVLFMTTSSALAEFDHRLVVSGLCMTTIMDFMWLLRPQEGAFNGYLRVQLENATHLSLAVCAAIKLWLIFAAYFDLGPDPDESLAPAPPPVVPGTRFSIQRIRYRIWSSGRFLLPRKTLPRRSHLSYEVLMRVLGLIWIHGVCGFLLLLLGLIAIMGFSGRAVFRSAKLGIPLPLVMLFKSASTLMSYVLATHNMSYHGCLKVSGCDALARYHEESASDVVLKYNAKWVRRVKHAKVVDALLGVYLMAALYSAVHSTTFIAGETVVAVLALTAMILIVLDIWTPLLIMVVARCGAVLHEHHRNGTVDVDPYFPNQLEWDDDDEDGDAKRARNGASSSSSSGSDDSSYENSDDSSQSDSGESTDSSTRRRRRLSRANRSQRRLESKASSRSPLIPPLKRANSMLIVDAEDLADREDLTNGFKPYWVRYWDDSTGRSYLVHSVTNETVWEIGTPAAVSRPSLSARAGAAQSGMMSARSGAATPRSVFNSGNLVASSSALAKASPRVPLVTAASFPPTTSSSRLSPRRAPHSARASSHPTSESDIIVTTPGHGPPAVAATSSLPPRGPLSPDSARRNSGARSSASSSRTSSALLSAEDFTLLWDGLPDGGNFTCRVSKVPNAQELTQHLHLQGFTVASDGLNLASLRSVHFYAIAASTAVTDGSLSRRPSAVAFFLGEFVFDSLSLKLYAKFRCPEVDAIVPFVKKLQLKEIVGAYAPCD